MRPCPAVMAVGTVTRVPNSPSMTASTGIVRSAPNALSVTITHMSTIAVVVRPGMRGGGDP
jgi:hypothetical protein